MKKILTALLVVLSVFALVSCSSTPTVTTTEVKLNAANTYTSTATLAKELTAQCKLYYKSGSTSTGYIPAADGVVPIFDSTGDTIGTIVVKYTANKLLSFTYVTTRKTAATGTADITVGVLSNGTMDPYGIYSVNVVYTPDTPAPIPVYTDAIALYAEPNGVPTYEEKVTAKNVDIDEFSFVASCDDAIAFIGAGTDYTKYQAIPFYLIKDASTSSVQWLALDEYNAVMVEIEKVGVATDVRVVYFAGADKDEEGDYPAAKVFFAPGKANLVIAGYQKNAKGEIVIDTDKVNVFSEFIVGRTAKTVAVAEDGKVKNPVIKTAGMGEPEDLGVFINDEFQFTLAEAATGKTGQNYKKYEREDLAVEERQYNHPVASSNLVTG